MLALACWAGLFGGCASTAPASAGPDATTPESQAPPRPRWQDFLEPLDGRPRTLILERLREVDGTFEARPDCVIAAPSGGRLVVATTGYSPDGDPWDRTVQGAVQTLDAPGDPLRVLAQDLIVSSIEPSPDGSYVALLARDRDSGHSTWRILDTDAGTQIGPPLDGVAGGGFAWLPDLSGVVRATEVGAELSLVRRTFASGEEQPVWAAPASITSIDLTASDDGSQVIAVGRREDGSTGAWLVDLFGGPSLDLAAQFAEQPREWRAVGASGPLAFLLAIHDDGRYGGRVVAVDRRRQGAPTLEILRVDGHRIEDATLAAGHIVVARTAPWDGASSLAIHSASGAVERIVELPGVVRLRELRGSPRGDQLVALWSETSRPTIPIAIDPRTGAMTEAISGRPARFEVRASVERGTDHGQAQLIADCSAGYPATAPRVSVNPPSADRTHQLWVALGGAIQTDSTQSVLAGQWGDSLDPMADALVRADLIPMADAAERINEP
ncbi:hypothetical protein [Engelhardtia mirabilis]|uniref:Peptidase S9A N-terminal domain-containing protein n=1 Tax=Engelhardtia mirabilis TaxID=2528011 RepID=A0A518BR40_9BACT|nr:hypothetical protein Pla133_45460 [Planctomycetes bacterium Pla133]QDV03752.1 hypothetical protein Pla86_45440 [Planctomycetes bacterium Pla86]